MTTELSLLPRSSILEGRNASESDLLERCRQGSLSAYESLYSAHASRMKSIAFHILRDRPEAEDAVQETFLRVFRSIGSFEGQSGFDAWMYRILINCCYDATRKRQRQAESEMVAEPVAPTNVPLKLAVKHALERIHPSFRTVFWLFEAEGFRHSEIAGILEIPEGTSRKWLFDAKRELKKLLGEVRS